MAQVWLMPGCVDAQAWLPCVCGMYGTFFRHARQAVPAWLTRASSEADMCFKSDWHLVRAWLAPDVARLSLDTGVVHTLFRHG